MHFLRSLGGPPGPQSRSSPRSLRYAVPAKCPSLIGLVGLVWRVCVGHFGEMSRGLQFLYQLGWGVIKKQ